LSKEIKKAQELLRTAPFPQKEAGSDLIGPDKNWTSVCFIFGILHKL